MLSLWCWFFSTSFPQMPHDNSRNIFFFRRLSILNPRPAFTTPDFHFYFLFYFIFISFIFSFFFFYRSNHSGNNGSSGSLPSSAGPSLNSEDISNGDHLLNNNPIDNGIAEICDVPEEVANHKRHVSNQFFFVPCLSVFIVLVLQQYVLYVFVLMVLSVCLFTLLA